VDLSYFAALLALLASLPSRAAKMKVPMMAIVVKRMSWMKSNSKRRITSHTDRTRTSKIKALLLILTPQLLSVR